MADTQENTTTKENLEVTPGTLVPYVGTIMCFASPYIPRDWLPCDGRSVPVAKYGDLYSLIKNIYGGNNVNFNLPDLRGRVMVGQGQSTSGTNYPLGQKSGAERVTMTASNMPAHIHTVASTAITVPVNNTDGADTDDPTNAVFGQPASRGKMYGATPNNSALMAPLQVSVASVGSSIPFDITTPYLANNYCIAMFGVYPSRP